ncbi:leucine-rich repeat-containing protein 15-like [Venturia canescens]|uniref:leucine-rich repeat-containing protein 15-like n=1 Tax=Venturia canescens TaxID=32260 RepID=UPI001C9BD3BD|nr:leucine-rich repeat-containing protein 15-like [Venturia canescens]
MVALSRLVSLMTIVFAFFVASARSDSNVVVNRTIAPTSNARTEKPPIDAPTTKKTTLCDTCDCSDAVVNCTDLELDHHFDDSLWPLKPLEKILFKGNILVHLKPFPNITASRLILSGNRITKIDDKAFKEISNLTELDLSHNQLTSELLRPAVFEGRFSVEEYEPLDQLRILNLGYNALHTLKQDVFEHVSDLRVLILSGNPLTTIDQGTANAISQLLYLEDLDLSYCELAAVPDHLFHAPSHLKKLNLNGNDLKSPPSALEDCKALEHLSLDENPFELLDRSVAFPVMPSLKELSLGSLPYLTSVGHSVFSQLMALESISLRNCPKLTEIDEDAFVRINAESAAIWPPVKELDLSNNALRYLSFNLLGRWDRLEKLELIDNEWSCDCDNQYLIGTLLPEMGKKLMGKEIDALKCSAPPEHAGKNLTSLANRKLRCLDLYGARPEHDAAILIGVLIGLLLAIPVALTTFVFWRRGFFFCGAQGPASFSRAFYKRANNDDVI